MEIALIIMGIILFSPAVLALALYIRRKRNYRKAAAHWERLQREIKGHEYLD